MKLTSVLSILILAGTVTLTFASDEPMAASPACVFATGGEAVTGTAVTITDISSGTAWSCVYAVVAGDTAGAVSFTIDGADLAGNALVQVTSVTDGAGAHGRRAP